MEYSLYKLEIFVPPEAFAPVRQALFSVDAGHIGNYDRCLSWSPVKSCWWPLEGTLQAIRAAHPYEEPVINVLPLLATGLEW